MTSKEALERLLMLARPCAYEVREHRNSYCDMLENAITQDLERLEQLEKDNKELRKAVKSWNDSIPKLIHENLKLKKAIEILKDHFKLYYNRYTDVYELKADLPLSKIITKKTYEILKEVLGYE